MKRKIIACCLFLATTNLGCYAKTANSPENVLHVLDRLTFGPKPGDFDSVTHMGIDKFIKRELKPDSMDENERVKEFISASPSFNLSATQLYQQYSEPAVKQAKIDQQLTDSVDDKKKLEKIRNDLSNKILKDVYDAKIMRAVDSNRQLDEVMTNFWYNHFNVFAQKGGGQDKFYTGAYEQQAIRPYALGKFRDLLGATCHHPAMLYYLDNWQNTVPGYRKTGNFAGLNENYARELMELHSLGVDGGYSQKDVIELARVLTGLGLPSRDPKHPTPEEGLGYYFDPKRHDTGPKVLLGVVIQPGGESEIEQALDILAAEPATAHHVCYQLAQYFVCDQPSDDLVNRLSQKFLKSKGDIKAVLAVLFKSPEFWDPKNFNSKFKDPFRFVVSSVRAANIDPTDFTSLQQFLRQQGMPLYGCLTPDGYKNTTEAWLNPDSLIRRTSFVSSLASGKYKGAESQPLAYQALAAALGDNFAPKTQQALSAAPDNLKSSLVLGSPDFMRY